MFSFSFTHFNVLIMHNQDEQENHMVIFVGRVAVGMGTYLAVTCLQRHRVESWSERVIYSLHSNCKVCQTFFPFFSFFYQPPLARPDVQRASDPVLDISITDATINIAGSAPQSLYLYMYIYMYTHRHRALTICGLKRLIKLELIGERPRARRTYILQETLETTDARRTARLTGSCCTSFPSAQDSVAAEKEQRTVYYYVLQRRPFCRK